LTAKGSNIKELSLSIDFFFDGLAGGEKKYFEKKWKIWAFGPAGKWKL
jgi:hypothetical protein